MNNNRGFSLIEAMVVCALIALVMALVGANSTYLNRILVRTETEKLHTICRYLQSCAMVSNTSHELRFDVQNKSYHFHEQEHKLPKQIMFGFISGSKGPPSSPNTALQNPVTFTDNRIIFYPDGIIQSGTVYLVDTSKSYMYALSSPISQVSYLRKYRYGKSWQLID